MKSSIESQTLLRNGMFFIVFCLPLVLVSVLILALARQARAGFDCSGNIWSVNNESALNSAIACYNSQVTAGSYTITFTQNISLTTNTTGISNTTSGVALVLDGSGLTIDGQNIEGVRPFTIEPDTVVTIQNIWVTGGHTTADAGGGIRNEGELTLQHSTVSGNVTSHNGGGIGNEGTLIVIDCTISDNSTDNSGGGLMSDSGTLTVNNSVISGNTAERHGGGIYSFNGTLAIDNSTINGNSATNAGGGIVTFVIVATINNSTIRDNTANHEGGGLHGGGNVTINNSTISNNSVSKGPGGGINHFTFGSTLVINNSTISGNSATDDWGGGIITSFDTTTSISSSTISDNSSITSDNLAGRAGGILNSGILNIDNSIIANSTGNEECLNFGGTINDIGYNIVEDNSCGFTGGSDPMLAPLQDNGGPTFTHALFPGSPAINRGNTTLTTDQRGASRPQGLSDDIGAFEGTFVFSDFVYLPIVRK